ncbi:MAG: hypothetical protein IT438_12255 [Phycisphaerales bacterium]|nr:hypothetical protein [Phycisphaerales bacterium]
MNDRQIHDLMRVAHEIEELERSALGEPSSVHPATLRIVDREHARRLRAHRRTWLFRTVGIAAAAACVGFAVRISIPTPNPPHGASPTNVASTDEPPNRTSNSATTVAAKPTDRPAVAPPRAVQYHIARNTRSEGRADANGSVVLAIYEDAGGVVRCVRWREHDFGGRDISAVRPGELAAVTYGSQCVVGPHRLIAVGLSGPRDQLPTTEERAQAMAQCIIGGNNPTGCDIEPSAASSSTLSCLPNGLKVMVETLAMGK